MSYIKWDNNTKIDKLKDFISKNEDRINDLEKENLELTIKFEKINNNEHQDKIEEIDELKKEYELQSEFHFLRTEEEKELTLKRIKSSYEQARDEDEKILNILKKIEQQKNNNLLEIGKIKKQIEEYQYKIYDLRN